MKRIFISHFFCYWRRRHFHLNWDVCNDYLMCAVWKISSAEFLLKNILITYLCRAKSWHHASNIHRFLWISRQLRIFFIQIFFYFIIFAISLSDLSGVFSHSFLVCCYLLLVSLSFSHSLPHGDIQLKTHEMFSFSQQKNYYEWMNERTFYSRRRRIAWSFLRSSNDF